MKVLFLKRIALGMISSFVRIGLGGLWKMSVLMLFLAVFSPGALAEDSAESEKRTTETGHHAEEVALDQVQGLLPLLESYLESRSDRLTELVGKYRVALDARFNRAADAGDLALAAAFDEEKKLLETLSGELGRSAEDAVEALALAPSLPDLPGEDTPEGLSLLRETWTSEREKILKQLDVALDRSLATMEAELTKARELERAKIVHKLRTREEASGDAAMAAEAGGESDPGRANGESVEPDRATIEAPFVSSLGMRFVPVPIHGGPSDGKLVLFSIWETRVKDFLAFVRENPRYEQKSPFPQEVDHPVLLTSWEEAVAFCEWLTERDRERGLIDESVSYRLPTDHEWSCAIGIGRKEDADAPPLEKTRALADVYPWGDDWPPRETVGNFYGQESLANPLPNPIRSPIEEYDDGFDRTSPVGRFEPSAHGLYDLSGNVWEWCADWYSIAEQGRVLRGGSYESDRAEGFLSSSRIQIPPDSRAGNAGFRCVLSEKIE